MALVVLSALTVSFTLGAVFFYLGLAQKTEEISAKYLPFYDRYVKIQDLRKRIFIKKMNNLGITKELLDKNPELRKKVEDKFDRNVLGKIYIYRAPKKCLVDSFKCERGEIFFEDLKGCGCRQIYSDLKPIN